MIVWFSHGAASSVALKMAIQNHSEEFQVEGVCCDTRPSENSDNYRFTTDVESWVGQQIQFVRSKKYKTVDEVFEKERFMSGPKGARCTVELKKKPRWQFATLDDVNVFGFTAGERRRAKDFTQRNPEMKLKWLLIELGISKADCYQIVKDAGIMLPLMYRLGFDNNNCPGCVKATSPWYWDMTRTHFPDVFERRCRQSRAIGAKLVEMKGVRIFLDELPPGPFKRYKRKENLSCGPECGISTVAPRWQDDPLFN